MSTFVRYFANGILTVKAIGAGLQGIDREFKIDGGDVTHGGNLLGELEVCSSGSDMFNEDLAMKISQCEQAATHEAYGVVARLRATQSIVSLRILDGGWDQLTPLWSVLPQLAPGLTHVEGQGFYDGSQLLAAIA